MTGMRRYGVANGTVAQCSSCERRTSHQAEPITTRTNMEAERFEAAYRRIWAALRRTGEPGLPTHARRLLRHLPSSGATSLTALAEHLQLPKSTTSVLVKALADRGLLTRARDPEDERRLRIALTEEGRRRLAGDTLLAPEPLARALAALPQQTREDLLSGLEALAHASEQLASSE
jgi:MarR family transcriptional regulator, organic hydroperoxide resistance regulator